MLIYVRMYGMYEGFYYATIRYVPTAKCIRAAVGDPDLALYEEKQVRQRALPLVRLLVKNSPTLSSTTIILNIEHVYFITYFCSESEFSKDFIVT
jgi:hypothetical protein